MALIIKRFDEKSANQLLQPCWLAGERKFSINKLLSRQEIRLVDVVSSCNKIEDLIEQNKVKYMKINTNAVDTCNRNLISFKDIARLTFGASSILTQQVSMLLNDAEDLLKQIKGTNFDTQLLHTVNLPKRKCKSIINNHTMCVAKRARIQPPQPLDEQHIEYYRNVLTEMQQWNTCGSTRSADQSETIQISEHVITITHEVIVTEIEDNILWNNGFGGPTEQQEFEAYLPERIALKRKFCSPVPTDALANKAPRLATDTTETSSHNLQEPSTSQELGTFSPPATITGVQELEIHSPLATDIRPQSSAAPAISNIRKVKSRDKLKIDKNTKLSREELLRDRHKYIKANKRNAKQLLKSKQCENDRKKIHIFKHSQLYLDRIKTIYKMAEENIERDCEYTLRAILEESYSDALCKEIFGVSQTEPALSQLQESLESYEPQIIEQHCNNNNNNPIININGNDYKNSNFDSYAVMMDLLQLFRRYPDKPSIDANEYINSFPTRFKAAVAFSHLLTLSREGFIKLSNQPDSMEIGGITLGTESIRLIENISQSDKAQNVITNI